MNIKPVENYGAGLLAVTPVKLTEKSIQRVEEKMLQMEQANCPVVHRFGPGIYIRELSMRAGTLAIGHRQKCVHMNVFIKGRVTVVNDDGSHTELVAPMTFVGKPGRKFGYVHEDVIWQNVYATNETDIETLESMFLEKSDAWQSAKREKDALLLECASDQEDYRNVLREFGFTEEIARAQSENEADQIPFPLGSYKVAVSRSAIEGKGLFATSAIDAGEVIAPARIAGKRTPAGRFTNHAAIPNACMVRRPDGDIELIAMKPIAGCAGGELGEEITIDYREALRLQIKPLEEK